jgi:hypothetical protein
MIPNSKAIPLPSLAAYQAAVRTCWQVKALLLLHDIPGMLRASEDAHRLGLILEDEEILRAALALRDFRGGR